MNHIEVDLRTANRDKTVFVPCPKCGRVLPIRYDSVTKCNCGIEICRSDNLTQSITSEVEL